jgi:hypothetical protein
MWMAHRHFPAAALAVLAASVVLVAGGGVAHAQPPPPYMGDYDLNHDNAFDALDMGYFFQCWRMYKAGNPLTTPVTYAGWTGTVADGDFNKDNVINYLDAKMICEEWLLPFPHIHPSQVTATKVAAPSKAGAVSTSAAPVDNLSGSYSDLNSASVLP